jgi:LmbE family N-acetylglucosaminyl deacetylase
LLSSVTRMRSRLLSELAVASALALLAPTLHAATAQAKRRHPAMPTAPTSRPFAVPQSTRLLVVAPHPDDEVIGAGGLMQRVHVGGGAIRVVYLTNGEGYPEGAALDEHRKRPTAADFRDYGRKREREAKTALGALNLGDYTPTFLNFPDGGLTKLMRSYWSDRRAAYRSPYTRRDRPRESTRLVPATEYRGEDLTQELAQIIGDFRPTMVVVPRSEDQHADHCASWFFVADALTDVRRVHTGYSADVVNYIVHWYSWPFDNDGPRLDPPPKLRGGASGWMTLPLTVAEARAKHLALRSYRTQMEVMSWFLDGFARGNELFTRPASSSVVLPARRELCDQP